MGKKALAIQGTSERLSRLRQDLCDFDVPILLSSATKTVVWMKEKGESGKMQYLDVGAEGGEGMALACYRAGHSLYFNPSLAVQKEYLLGLGQDLGLGLAMEMERGKGIGGDMEVFAVCGRHLTPWHFDAQENLTVQLKGTKRWWLCPNGISDVMTNLHPSSSNRGAVHQDMMVHGSYCQTDLSPPDESTSGVVSVVLRPGSVLYVPGGMWHRVEALEETGSLSINMSVDGARWCDVLLRSLGPVLWRDPEWRRRLTTTSPQEARSHLTNLLSRLPALLSTLSAEDFIPDGIMEARPCRIVIDCSPEVRRGVKWKDDEKWREVAQEQATAVAQGGVESSIWCRRNPLVVLAFLGEGVGDDSGRVHASLHWGFTQDSFQSSVKVDLEVTKRLEGALRVLATLPPNVPINVSPKGAVCWGEGGEVGSSDTERWILIGVLMYNGYLKQCQAPEAVP